VHVSIRRHVVNMIFLSIAGLDTTSSNFERCGTKMIVSDFGVNRSKVQSRDVSKVSS